MGQQRRGAEEARGCTPDPRATTRRTSDTPRVRLATAGMRSIRSACSARASSVYLVPHLALRRQLSVHDDFNRSPRGRLGARHLARLNERKKIATSCEENDMPPKCRSVKSHCRTLSKGKSRSPCYKNVGGRVLNGTRIKEHLKPKDCVKHLTMIQAATRGMKARNTNVATFAPPARRKSNRTRRPRKRLIEEY